MDSSDRYDGTTGTADPSLWLLLWLSISFLAFFMLFIMIGLPGALALYYATSNIFAAIQQHYILKRDVVEMDKLADNEIRKEGRKATAKAREKLAREATVTKTNITRITAKDTPRSTKKEEA